MSGRRINERNPNDLSKLKPPINAGVFVSVWVYCVILQSIESAPSLLRLANLVEGAAFIFAAIVFYAAYYWIVKRAVITPKPWARWVLTAILVFQLLNVVAGFRFYADVSLIIIIASLAQIPLLGLLVYWLLERSPHLWPSVSSAVVLGEPVIDAQLATSHDSSTPPSNSESVQHSFEAFPLRAKQIAGAIIIVGAVYGLVQLASKYWTDKDLAVEVIQTYPDGTPIYNTRRQFGVVRITNVADSPIVIGEIRINGSRNDTCSQKKAINLGPGEATNFLGGMYGQCGNILRVAVSTDKGADDYTINWH